MPTAKKPAAKKAPVASIKVPKSAAEKAQDALKGIGEAFKSVARKPSPRTNPVEVRLPVLGISAKVHPKVIDNAPVGSFTVALADPKASPSKATRVYVTVELLEKPKRRLTNEALTKYVAIAAYHATTRRNDKFGRGAEGFNAIVVMSGKGEGVKITVEQFIDTNTFLGNKKA